MHRERDDTTEGKTELVSTISEFVDRSLRDVWLFDQEHHECLYLRDDVSDRIESIEVGQYIDNERYGFITRATYKQLYYADYEYTIRGFDQFEQFRTFLAETPSHKIGVFVSIDRGPNGHNYVELYDHIVDVVASHSISEFVPAADRSRPVQSSDSANSVGRTPKEDR